MRSTVSFIVLMVVSAVARGHDYWLQPETFVVAPRQTIAVKLLVGDDLEVETERAFERKAIVSFETIHGTTRKDALAGGAEGKKPFAKLSFEQPGLHWIALERERRSVRLEAAKFNDYLVEEGLERILEQRRIAKEDVKPARERYTRHLKSLIRCGEKSDDTWKTPLGQRLEIVPLADPTSVKAGETLEFRVLFEKKPLAGVAVFALHREGEKVHKQKLTTNADGVVKMKASHAGPWLVRLVHMRRCPDAADADWESFWAALSFAVRG